MLIRYFLHREDPQRRRECRQGPDGSVTLVQIRGQRREVKDPRLTLEGLLEETAHLGYDEVDERGAPVPKPGHQPDPAGLAKLEAAVRSDPYNTFVRAQKALLTNADTAAVLRVLLEALTHIEADVDEHEGANYQAYFPPTDEAEPSYEAIAVYRAHYTRLAKQVRKERPSDADLAWRYAGRP